MPTSDGHFIENETELDAKVVQAAYARLSTAAPPALLDQAVLNMARREATSPPPRRITSHQWMGALATALVLVVSLGLWLQRSTAPPQSPGASAMRAPAPEQKHKGLRVMQDQATPRLEQSAEAAKAPMESAAAEAPAQVMKNSAVKSDDPDTNSQANAQTDTGADTGADTAAGPEVDPVAWLQRIIQLQQAGDTQQASAELRSFRTTYPDYPLPQALLD